MLLHGTMLAACQMTSLDDVLPTHLALKLLKKFCACNSSSCARVVQAITWPLRTYAPSSVVTLKHAMTCQMRREEYRPRVSTTISFSYITARSMTLYSTILVVILIVPVLFVHKQNSHCLFKLGIHPVSVTRCTGDLCCW